MAKKHSLKPVTSALGLTLAATMSAGTAQADTNPFAVSEISSGYEVAGNDHEGKCGEGKCGEGKCGGKTDKEDKREKEQCDGKADKEGKCGEGKCGGKAEKEGKCGGSH